MWYLLLRSSCIITFACKFCAILLTSSQIILHDHCLRILCNLLTSSQTTVCNCAIYWRLLRLSCMFLQILCNAIDVFSDHLASSIFANLFTSSQSILRHHCLHFPCNSIDMFSIHHAWLLLANVALPAPSGSSWWFASSDAGMCKLVHLQILVGGLLPDAVRCKMYPSRHGSCIQQHQPCFG